MGRLFWKFFFFIWLAQLSAMLGIGATFWLHDRAREQRQDDIDLSPPAAFLVAAAAATLEHGGLPGLRGLLEGARRDPVYALADDDRELLGRPVAPAVIAQARSLLAQGGWQPRVRRVTAPDGSGYVLFAPMTERHRGRPPPSDGGAGQPFPGGRPPPDDGPPGGGRAWLPVLPIAATVLASLLFAGLLARYVAKPIQNLRSAFETAAAGNLGATSGAAVGNRRDELADLGRDFDRMAARLRALMDGQRRLLHDVSHELRSPLARLHAAIGLLRQQPERLDASLGRIEREAVRMDKLVGELLTLSRLEAGVLGARSESIEIGELLDGIVADARFEAASRHCRVDLAAGAAAIVVNGVPELLHRAIENVIRNAVRHAPEGGSVAVAAHADGGECLLTVLDDGPGVPDALLDAIFQPFFRGNGPTSGDGYGLGLAIARRVVESHGGRIRASNRAGGGLCVEIALPVVAGP